METYDSWLQTDLDGDLDGKTAVLVRVDQQVAGVPLSILGRVAGLPIAWNQKTDGFGDIAGGENVVIAKTGNVLGNIESPRVTLEDGAKFKGSIEMDPGDKAIKELPLSTPSNVKAHRSAPDSDAKAS